jgi:hypothetical protein
MNPISTRKVINRIASRHSNDSLTDLQSVLDRATSCLWNKQEYYYKKIQRRREGTE